MGSACTTLAIVSQDRKESRIPRRRNTGPWLLYASFCTFSDVTIPKMCKAFSSPADRTLTTSTDVT